MKTILLWKKKVEGKEIEVWVVLYILDFSLKKISEDYFV